MRLWSKIPPTIPLPLASLQKYDTVVVKKKLNPLSIRQNMSIRRCGSKPISPQAIGCTLSKDCDTVHPMIINTSFSHRKRHVRARQLEGLVPQPHRGFCLRIRIDSENKASHSASHAFYRWILLSSRVHGQYRYAGTLVLLLQCRLPTYPKLLDPPRIIYNAVPDQAGE